MQMSSHRIDMTANDDWALHFGGQFLTQAQWHTPIKSLMARASTVDARQYLWACFIVEHHNYKVVRPLGELSGFNDLVCKE